MTPAPYPSGYRLREIAVEAGLSEDCLELLSDRGIPWEQIASSFRKTLASPGPARDAVDGVARVFVVAYFMGVCDTLAVAVQRDEVTL